MTERTLFLQEIILRRDQVPDFARAVRYEETEHFRITREFLNRYPAMLRTLLSKEDPPA
jgi:hypothetical protein